MSISHLIEMKRYDLASSLLITEMQSVKDNILLRKDWVVLQRCLQSWLPLTADKDQRKVCYGEIEILPLFKEYDVDICTMFANTELKLTNYDASNFYFNKVLQKIPPDPLLFVTANNVRNSLVVRWSFRMLNDQIRNSSYKNAISRAINTFSSTNKSQPCVLDVGSGTGLLSLYCSTQGAGKVIAVEQDSTMYAISKYVCRNENIELHNCKSDELELDTDVDIVVTETLDSIAIGEGILRSCQQLSERSNFKNTIFIPSDISVYGFLISSELLLQSSFSAGYRTVVGTDDEKYCCEFIGEFPDLRRLSEPVNILRCKVGHPFDEKKIKIISFQASYSGWCDGVCSYFKAGLFDDIAITSAPDCIKCEVDSRCSAWEQGFHPLPRKSVKQGDLVKIKVIISDIDIKISWCGNDEMYDEVNILDSKQMKLLNSYIAKSGCSDILNVIPKICDVSGLVISDPMKFDAVSHIRFSGYVIHSSKLKNWTSMNESVDSLCLESDKRIHIQTLMNQYRTLIHQNVPWTTLEHTKLSDYIELVTFSCSKTGNTMKNEVQNISSLAPLPPTALVFWVEIMFKSGAHFHAANEPLWRPAAIIFPDNNKMCEKYTLHVSYKVGFLSASIELNL